jgi:hypothetical protein
MLIGHINGMYSVIPFISVDKTCVRMMVVIKVIVLLMEKMFVVFICLCLSTVEYHS